MLFLLYIMVFMLELMLLYLGASLLIATGVLLGEVGDSLVPEASFIVDLRAFSGEERLRTASVMT